MSSKPTFELRKIEDVALKEATCEPDLARPDVLRDLTDREVKELGVRTTRKLDLLIMPAMVVLYILNYLDRQNIAAARLANLVEDLSLSEQQYSTAVSILFVGYRKSPSPELSGTPVNTVLVIMQVPSNLIISATRWPALYMCAAVVLWGIMSACTAAVQSY